MPATILIIEDDDDFRIELQAMVASLGYGAALPRGAGDNAVRRAVIDGDYDLLIVNALMMKADGLRTIGLVRSANPACPVIATSGGSAEISAALSLKLAASRGADGVLYKPFGAHELRSLLLMLLQRCA